jgi:adenosylcobinamide-phosphate synthase
MNNFLAQIPEYLSTIHAQIFEPERLPAAIVALIIVTLLGMILGPLRGNANPFYWRLITLLFGKLGRRMNKAGRPKGDLIFRGFILSAIVLALSFLVGRLLEIAALSYSTWSIIEILSLCLCLSSGAVWASIGRLYRALNEKKVIPGAYYSIARSSFTDLSKNDDYTITRVGMGLALRSFDKAIVAPILWFLIGGLPLMFLYAGIAAMAWRFGKDGYSSGLGQAMIALEKLMGFVPNILSGVLIALAGILTPTAGMTRALLALFKSKGTARYAEGGLPVTAAAFALAVSLGGATKDLDSTAIKRNWVGPPKATAQLQAKHLHRVMYLCFMAHLLFLAALSAAMIIA